MLPGEHKQEKTMSFNYRFNYSPKDKTSKKVYGASKTIPDQSMSIKELIARNQRGLPLSGKQPIYGVSESDADEDAFSIAVNKMGHLDLAEREALQDQIAANIARLTHQAEQIAKAKIKAQEEALIASDEAQFNKFKQKLEKLQKDGQATNGQP